MADEPVHVTELGVTRSRRAWSATVHRLLSRLEDSGLSELPFPLSPPGDDVEAVSFVEGTPVADKVLRRDQVESLGRLLRSVHDASVDAVESSTDVWQPFDFRADLCHRTEEDSFLDEIVIGHGDTGPWNLLATPSGRMTLIDWEFAGPIVRLDELAATSWLAIRFHDPEVDAAAARSTLREKTDLLEAFLDAYGLPRSDWSEVVRGMSDYAIRDAAYEAIRLGITREEPSSDDTAQWRLAWRSRSAAWILRHRSEMLRQLGL